MVTNQHVWTDTQTNQFFLLGVEGSIGGSKDSKFTVTCHVKELKEDSLVYIADKLSQLQDFQTFQDSFTNSYNILYINMNTVKTILYASYLTYGASHWKDGNGCVVEPEQVLIVRGVVGWPHSKSWTALKCRSLECLIVIGTNLSGLAKHPTKDINQELHGD